MLTVNSEFFSQIEIKKSKFISYLVPYSKYNQIYNNLKKEHSKATHFITAFRYKNSLKQIIEGSSDDGEPKGTSGKPTLNVLIGADLIDIGVITIRYFGGVKLGTGGLVGAYSDAINSTIKIANLIESRDLIQLELNILFKNISKFKYLIQKFACETIYEEFNEFGGKFIINCEENYIAEFNKINS